LDSAAALLDQGIDADVVIKLIKNKADLGDIAINVQNLLDGGVRVDLVNKWLDNGTHLNDAICGWVLRVKRGSEYLDAAGTFYKDTIEKPRSPNYNPSAINDTHIPIRVPDT
jgi:hypothetical protein